MGKSKLVALLSLSSWCLVIAVWLFLTVPWVSLQFVIVVFLDHTYLLFFTVELKLLKQGYQYHKLQRSFAIFYNKHTELIVKIQYLFKFSSPTSHIRTCIYGDLVYKFKRIVGKLYKCRIQHGYHMTICVPPPLHYHFPSRLGCCSF